MKKRIGLAAVGLAIPALVWLTAQVQNTPASLSTYFPGGAALYLESRDFSALLADWSGSPEKQAWLKSANYEVFSRSRLFLRLQEAQTEFSDAARIGPDMALVNSIAGSESAIAIYDIGKLEFLYISRLPSATALATALWQTRTSYESRSSAGNEYFVRTSDKGRVASFAAANGLLLLSTREDLMASALALLASQDRPALTRDRWFEQALKTAGPAGELRMLLNIPALIKSPHFRSYWVQRNTSELKQYADAVVDLVRESGQWREERVFVREQPVASRSQEEADVARVTAWAPDDMILRRAWARPAVSDALALIASKIADPGSQTGGSNRYAPAAMGLDNAQGSESDLETRIDQPPLPAAGQPADLPELRLALEKTGVAALIHMQTSRRGPDGVFVATDAAIGLLGSADWPNDVARLLPFARVAGRALIVANSDAMLAAVAARVSSPPVPSAGVYVARYLHAAELPQFQGMMQMIDRSRARGDYGGSTGPAFFSGNVASLGRVLARLESESVTVRDDGASVKQQVLYRFNR